MRGALKAKGAAAIILKILVNSLQFNAVASSFDYDWPYIVLR